MQQFLACHLLFRVDFISQPEVAFRIFGRLLYYCQNYVKVLGSMLQLKSSALLAMYFASLFALLFSVEVGYFFYNFIGS